MTVPQTSDLSITRELKALWAQYGHHPSVRYAFKLALADSQVTPLELLAIHASIARAVVDHIGGWAAFLLSNPDSKLIAELEAAMKQHDPALTIKIGDILKDSVVTHEELMELRTMVAQSMAVEACGPSVRVKIPSPSRPSMPWKTLKNTSEDDDND